MSCFSWSSISQLRQLSSCRIAWPYHITLNRNVINTSPVVRDLDALFDNELSKRQHISLIHHISPASSPLSTS